MENMEQMTTMISIILVLVAILGIIVALKSNIFKAKIIGVIGLIISVLGFIGFNQLPKTPAEAFNLIYSQPGVFIQICSVIGVVAFVFSFTFFLTIVITRTTKAINIYVVNKQNFSISNPNAVYHVFYWIAIILILMYFYMFINVLINVTSGASFLLIFYILGFIYKLLMIEIVLYAMVVINEFVLAKNDGTYLLYGKKKDKIVEVENKDIN